METSKNRRFSDERSARRWVEAEVHDSKPLDDRYWGVITKLEAYCRWRDAQGGFEELIDAVESVLDLHGVDPRALHRDRPKRVTANARQRQNALLAETLLESIVSQYQPMNDGRLQATFWWFDREGRTLRLGIEEKPVGPRTQWVTGLSSVYTTNVWQLFSLDWHPDPNLPPGVQKIRASISPWASASDVALGIETLQRRIGCKESQRRHAAFMIAGTEHVRCRLEGKTLDLPELLVRLKADVPDQIVPRTLQNPAKALPYIKQLVSDFEFPGWSLEPIRVDSRDVFQA